MAERRRPQQIKLRKWFSHDTAKWTAFQHKYFAELERRPEAWGPILKAARSGVTLLYSSNGAEDNNAAALKRFFEAKTAHKRAGAAH